MVRFGSQRYSGGLSALALLLVILAQVSRIAMPNVVMGVADDETAAFDAVAILCQTGAQPAPAKHVPLHHESGLTCVLCQSAAHADAMVPSPVYVPYATPGPVMHAAVLPGARAPPVLVLASLYPTGPPART